MTTDLEHVPDTIGRTPPNDAEAEKAVLGACLQSAGALQATQRIINAADFYHPRHETIWHSIERLQTAGEPVDIITIQADLTRTGDIQRIGGALYLYELTATPTIPGNATYYAEIVADSATRRRLIDTATRIQQLAFQSSNDPHQQAADALVLIQNAAKASRQTHYAFQGAGAFILDQPDTIPAWWGNGTDILGAQGEALMIAGPQGSGKSTLGQQLALGRAGFPDYNQLLGYPIAPGQRVLYLAMDRPQQVARSLRRMVNPHWRDQLDDRIPIWKGPPPHDLAKRDTVLLEMCQAAQADTVIIDSLKDAAIGLVDDEVGAAYNRARQRVLAAGIEVIELHHTRKTANGTKRETVTVDDIYGSTWLTSGAGSVLFLNGQPGDPIIEMHHVKQPMDEVGPYKLIHDHPNGSTKIWHEVDLVEVTRIRGSINAKEAAGLTCKGDNPTDSEIQKARRNLEKLTDQGLLTVIQPGTRGGTPTTWGPSRTPRTEITDQITPPPPVPKSRPNHANPETPSQSNHEPIHANHAPGKSRAGGSLKEPPRDTPTPTKIRCTICRGPMTDLGDGQTTHPSCTP